MASPFTNQSRFRVLSEPSAVSSFDMLMCAEKRREGWWCFVPCEVMACCLNVRTYHPTSLVIASKVDQKQSGNGLKELRNSHFLTSKTCASVGNFQRAKHELFIRAGVWEGKKVMETYIVCGHKVVSRYVRGTLCPRLPCKLTVLKAQRVELRGSLECDREVCIADGSRIYERQLATVQAENACDG